MFLRAQNPVCLDSRSLESVCESAVQALLTLGTKLISNEDLCWVHCSGVEMGKEKEISAFLLLLFFSLSDMLHSFPVTNYIGFSV